jgi:CheY-like chemotaxis protein
VPGQPVPIQPAPLQTVSSNTAFSNTVPDAAPTILLVDDEDSVRTVLAFPLERDGYTVVQAADGEEALRLFDATQIDLVVLDIMLPKLDG